MSFDLLSALLSAIAQAPKAGGDATAADGNAGAKAATSSFADILSQVSAGAQTLDQPQDTTVKTDAAAPLVALMPAAIAIPAPATRLVEAEALTPTPLLSEQVANPAAPAAVQVDVAEAKDSSKSAAVAPDMPLQLTSHAAPETTPVLELPAQAPATQADAATPKPEASKAPSLRRPIASEPEVVTPETEAVCGAVTPAIVSPAVAPEIVPAVAVSVAPAEPAPAAIAPQVKTSSDTQAPSPVPAKTVARSHPAASAEAPATGRTLPNPVGAAPQVATSAEGLAVPVAVTAPAVTAGQVAPTSQSDTSPASPRSVAGVTPVAVPTSQPETATPPATAQSLSASQSVDAVATPAAASVPEAATQTALPAAVVADAARSATAPAPVQASRTATLKTSAFSLKPLDDSAPVKAPVASPSVAKAAATTVPAVEATDAPAEPVTEKATAVAEVKTVPVSNPATEQAFVQPEAPITTQVQSAEATMSAAPAPVQTISASVETPALPSASAMAQVAVDNLATLGVAMAKKLKDGTTSFKIELHPADFGRVEVSLTIGRDGKVAAHLSFDSAATAVAFHARESELRQQLAQAGLDVAGDALSFSSPDDKPAAKTTPDAAAQPATQQAAFDAPRDHNNQARANSRRAARALADGASAAEDTDLDTHLAHLRRPVSRLALDVTV